MRSIWRNRRMSNDWKWGRAGEKYKKMDGRGMNERERKEKGKRKERERKEKEELSTGQSAEKQDFC